MRLVESGGSQADRLERARATGPGGPDLRQLRADAATPWVCPRGAVRGARRCAWSVRALAPVVTHAVTQPPRASSDVQRRQRGAAMAQVMERSRAIRPLPHRLEVPAQVARLYRRTNRSVNTRSASAHRSAAVRSFTWRACARATPSPPHEAWGSSARERLVVGDVNANLPADPPQRRLHPQRPMRESTSDQRSPSTSPRRSPSRAQGRRGLTRTALDLARSGARRGPMRRPPRVADPRGQLRRCVARWAERSDGGLLHGERLDR